MCTRKVPDAVIVAPWEDAMMELEEWKGCWHRVNRQVGYTLLCCWGQEGRTGMGSAGRSSLALFEAVGSSPGSENSQEGFLSRCQTGGVIWEGSWKSSKAHKELAGTHRRGDPLYLLLAGCCWDPGCSTGHAGCLSAKMHFWLLGRLSSAASPLSPPCRQDSR